MSNVTLQQVNSTLHLAACDLSLVYCFASSDLYDSNGNNVPVPRCSISTDLFKPRYPQRPQLHSS